MPRDACAIPPGREWAVTHLCPVVPGPIWDRYLRDGVFPPGMQAQLDETAHCHVNDVVIVKRGNDREIVWDANIPGFFPWGWYAADCPVVDEPDDVEEPEPDPVPDPEETIEFLEPAEFDRTIERAPIHQSGPLAEGVVGDCIPVRTVDVLAPWPVSPMPRMTIDGVLQDVPAGGFGRVVLRIPGTDHDAYGTGLGIVFTDERFLSPLGRAYVRQAHGQFAGLPGSWWYALWDGQHLNAETPRQWWTRDYAWTHMQPSCIDLRYPDGRPAEWRWRFGGDRPLAGVGAGWDIFEVKHHASGLWVNNWLTLRSYAAHLLADVPEAPLGTDQFNGPEPGAFFISGETAEDDDDDEGGDEVSALAPILPGTLGRAPSPAPELGGFFDDVGDFFDDFDDVAGDILEKVRDLAAEIWEHLPKEIRKVAIEIGPMAAGVFLPYVGMPVAKLAVSALEAGRKGELAKKRAAQDALKRAQADGVIPDDLDLDDDKDLLALRAAQEAPKRAGQFVPTSYQPGSQGQAGGGGGGVLVPAAAGVAALWALGVL